MQGLYENLTLFFPDLSTFKTLFQLSRVKLYKVFLKGDEHYFEFAGGSSYRGFESSGIDCKFDYDLLKCNTYFVLKRFFYSRCKSPRISAPSLKPLTKMYKPRAYQFKFSLRR